ncbi:MAG: DUF4249 family protein [Balneolaceae bacterium]|nr:DUF4249 family protein [Balneolaceae bacterium]
MIFLKKITLKNLFIIFIGSFLFVASCENTFDPIQDKELKYYSIFGALDALADTQWVRVMPIADSLFLNSQKPLNATVTLTRLSDDKKVTLHDSLFTYDNGVLAWNYWTDEPLYPKETYRLRVERPDGVFSEATTTLPDIFPEPEVTYSTNKEFGQVVLNGIDRLAAAQVNYRFFVRTGPTGETKVYFDMSIPHTNSLYEGADGKMRFNINDMLAIADSIKVSQSAINMVSRELIIAAAGPEWPDFKGFNDFEIGLPSIQSNVINGQGVVAGIISRRRMLE